GLRGVPTQPWSLVAVDGFAILGGKSREPDRMSAIRTTGLTYRYDSRHGVFDLGLEVPEGGIYAFLGPNGSGKTTTVRLLLGLLSPHAGTIRVGGMERVRGARGGAGHIGALVEAPSLYPHLTGRQ